VEPAGGEEVSVWTEYGVVLEGWDNIAPAASWEHARSYDRAPGRVVVARDVKFTALPSSGDAVVDFGEWRVVGKAVAA
jgi:hypothetical protein